MRICYPGSCSSIPVWPYSCADYLSIKRMFGTQGKPSWFVSEVHWGIVSSMQWFIHFSVLGGSWGHKKNHSLLVQHMSHLCPASAWLFRIFGCLFFGSVPQNHREWLWCSWCLAGCPCPDAVFSRNEEMWHVTHRRASADKSLAKMLPEQGWCRQEHILDNLSVVQIKDVRGKTLLTSTSKHFKIQKPPCLCQSLLDAVWGGMFRP